MQGKMQIVPKGYPMYAFFPEWLFIGWWIALIIGAVSFWSLWNKGYMVVKND
jgi:hypothetical protein